VQLHVDLRSDEAREVAHSLQRPVDTWRRHFEPLVIGILDRQQVRQLTADPLAVLKSDARRPIERHPQQAATGPLDIDKLVAEPLDRALYRCVQVVSNTRHRIPFRRGRSASPEIKNGLESPSVELQQACAAAASPRNRCPPVGSRTARTSANGDYMGLMSTGTSVPAAAYLNPETLETVALARACPPDAAMALNVAVMVAGSGIGLAATCAWTEGIN
jgi:hypothetical protein